VGVAVAIGGRVVAVDLFDRASTCERVWARLLSGPVLDALEAERPDENIGPEDVTRSLVATADLCWEPTESVGEGQEFRADTRKGDHASALVFEGTLIHGSVVFAA
jgi:hypothetical protein